MENSQQERIVQGRIVVGVDGSEGAQRALRWAVAQAVLTGSQLQVVHGWHYPFAGSSPFSGVAFDVGDLEAGARAALDSAVAGVDLGGLAAPPDLVVVEHSAALALVEAAKGADLLVVGTRGRGGFAELLLGSVSQQVVHHAPCPVVIVPHDA